MSNEKNGGAKINKLLRVILCVGLVMMLVPAIVIGGSYIFHNLSGNVTVTEPLIMTPDSFDFSIYPGDAKNVPCTIQNLDDRPWTVYFNITSTAGEGVTFILANGQTNFTIPKLTTEAFDLVVYAEYWCAPGNHSISIDVTRGEEGMPPLPIPQ